MASTDTNLSRRQALAGLSIIGAAAATPAIGATVASAPIADTRAWDSAFADWQVIRDEFDALWNRANEAEEAWGEASPRVDRYFNEYRLNTIMERGHVEGALSMYNTRQRLAGGTQIDVQQVADEFGAYLQRDVELRKYFRVGEHFEQAEAYRATYFRARDRIMEVPAPHVAALLEKIEIAAISLDDDHADSMLADARRLLANGRA